MSCRDSTGKAAYGIDVSATDAHARVGERIRVEAGHGDWPAGISSIVGPQDMGHLAPTRRTRPFLCDIG
jgi:hypothetical protein